jgi:hypothetical protein
MTDKEVLQKVIEKIMIVDEDDQHLIYICNKSFYSTHNIPKHKIVEELFCIEFPFNNNLDYNKTYAFLFHHDFAKAFWGEKDYHLPFGKIKAWQDNLQQMVLEENPIDYLRKFIEL